MEYTETGEILRFYAWQPKKLQNRRIMKHKKKTREPQSDLFKPSLEDIVNPSHALVRLTAVIDWHRLDTEFSQHF